MIFLIQIDPCFNSTMVRLKVIIMDATFPDQRFNSTMVRLKALTLIERDTPMRLVSIPQWFD